MDSMQQASRDLFLLESHILWVWVGGQRETTRETQGQTQGRALAPSCMGGLAPAQQASTLHTNLPMSGQHSGTAAASNLQKESWAPGLGA